MSFYSLTDELMIFDKHSYLVGDIKPILLTDILDPVDELTGNSFITQLVGYCYIKSNSELTIIGNLPARNIFGDYLDIFRCKNYLLTVYIDIMISCVFKFHDLLRLEFRNYIADLFHQLAIPGTKCCLLSTSDAADEKKGLNLS